eukprot:15468357-Alexandrium_andersonii.AAC.1
MGVPVRECARGPVCMCSFAPGRRPAPAPRGRHRGSAGAPSLPDNKGPRLLAHPEGLPRA